jgi:hypothetical protein
MKSLNFRNRHVNRPAITNKGVLTAWWQAEANFAAWIKPHCVIACHVRAVSHLANFVEFQVKANRCHENFFQQLFGVNQVIEFGGG